jgi:hypothetical protein
MKLSCFYSVLLEFFLLFDNFLQFNVEMMADSGPRFTGTKKGVFGLCSWAPLRKPSEPLEQNVTAVTQAMVDTNSNNNASSSVEHQQRSMGSGNNVSTAVNIASQSKQTSELKLPSPVVAGQRLIAKFNYNANPSSPLGAGTELTIRQMEKMTMIASHRQQEFWWLVELDDGRKGYVPANYVMPIEEKVTSLPWLANKPVEVPVPSNQPYKPYKSAYEKPTASAPSPYYCKVCEKGFNGPQPYSAHMSSRAHREELELQGIRE